MAFIKIANDAESVNRIFLEKLGISTKRNDNNTIGQFGSGSKFAPIAALRNGWRWINVGQDENGPYRMEYVVKEEAGFECVAFLYDDKFYKDSSFTVDAGVLSWDDNFQIFREAFANALDENIANDANYSISVVDEIVDEPGKFCVYLTAAPELMEIVDEFNKYFCIEREPIFHGHNGKVFDTYDNELNVYYKGVKVNNGVNATQSLPIFDYELNGITLNEERRVRYANDIDAKIVGLLSEIDASPKEEALSIATEIVRCANLKRYEVDEIHDYFSDYFRPGVDRSNFRTAWVNLHGEDSCIHTFSLRPYLSHIRMRGVKPVQIDSPFMYGLLQKAGVQTAEDVLGDQAEFDFCDLKPGLKKHFDRAFELVSAYDTRLSTAVSDLKFFKPKEGQDELLGVARGDSIYLSFNAFRDFKTLVGTLVHELDHIVSGYTDTDNAFRSIADDRIAELIINHFDVS